MPAVAAVGEAAASGADVPDGVLAPIEFGPTGLLWQAAMINAIAGPMTSAAHKCRMMMPIR